MVYIWIHKLLSFYSLSIYCPSVFHVWPCLAHPHWQLRSPHLHLKKEGSPQCPLGQRPAGGGEERRDGDGLDRSQSLFYFVPQEKRLIRRPPWGWKNMGESIFDWEDGPTRTKMHPNGWGHMSRLQGSWPELFFVHYPGRSTHFSKGLLPICSQGS